MVECDIYQAEHPMLYELLVALRKHGITNPKMLGKIMAALRDAEKEWKQKQDQPRG